MLKAAVLMEEKRHKESDGKGHIIRWNKSGEWVRYELTDFAKEVGDDEINWWITRKEKAIDEFRQRTERALQAVQTLKEASVKLKNKEPESYNELVSILREFAEQHSAEIELLYEYVHWLAERNSLAPNILFAFRVWGSTRLGDRWLKVDTESTEGPEQEVTKELVKIVLGLRSRSFYAFDKAYLDISEQIYESMDPEEAAGREITIAEDRIVALRRNL
jgi:hypothetical protein